MSEAVFAGVMILVLVISAMTFGLARDFYRDDDEV